jgi:hypothetical protein
VLKGSREEEARAFKLKPLPVGPVPQPSPSEKVMVGVFFFSPRGLEEWAFVTNTGVFFTWSLLSSSMYS